jgi:hypothetical protein
MWGGGGVCLIICEKLKMPCVGIFLKIECCEGMLSYTEVKMFLTCRNTVTVVLWYQYWHSNKIISSDLEYVCDSIAGILVVY